MLPVEYQSQQSAWMSTEIFHKWFYNSFVPTVRKELSSLGLEQKAVLVLDNCPAHPNAQDLVSEDGKITAYYLPPNVTSLIQPKDQGVLGALKRRYKKKILRRLLIEENGESVVEFLKSVDMKVVADLFAESWDEIDTFTIQKSCRKIIATEQHLLKSKIPPVASERKSPVNSKVPVVVMLQNLLIPFRSWDMA